MQAGLSDSSNKLNIAKVKMGQGDFLAVQWLRLCVPNAGGMGSIPGRGTKILDATQCGQINK